MKFSLRRGYLLLPLLQLHDAAQLVGQNQRQRHLQQIRHDKRDHAPAQHRHQPDGPGACLLYTSNTQKKSVSGHYKSRAEFPAFCLRKNLKRLREGFEKSLRNPGYGADSCPTPFLSLIHILMCIRDSRLTFLLIDSAQSNAACRLAVTIYQIQSSIRHSIFHLQVAHLVIKMLQVEVFLKGRCV